jgi:hypothetical protein
MTDPS